MEDIKQIPQQEADLLVKLPLKERRARAAALREAGWTLRGIAVPAGKSHACIKSWADTADPGLVKLVKDVPRPEAVAREKSVKFYIDVPPAERDELMRLTRSAARLRGWTSDAQVRRDALELDQLLIRYRERGVNNMQLARRMGVTRRAVAARFERIDGTRVNPGEKKRLAAEALQESAA